MRHHQHGNAMDRQRTGDIIRRARERAEAGLPREDYETFLRRQQMNSASPSSPEPPKKIWPRQNSPENAPPPRRLQAPPGLHDEDGQIALPISRPAPVPQWPLAGPLPPNAEPYLPPAGSSPPPRPPRPSNVPSLLDGSKIQAPNPSSFNYQSPTDSRDRDSDTYGSSIPQTPSTLSRPSTQSSVASIPDFPLPLVQSPPPPPPQMALPRRSTLGPPPSARRGASSFYSHLSYVSPIPEESPRTRSHTSYASSAAMPESWGTPSPAPTHQVEVFFDDTLTDVEPSSPSDSIRSLQYDDEGDDTQLVRSASVGRRGKAALVTTPTARDSQLSPPRPAVESQTGPFSDGTGFLEASTNSSNTAHTSVAAPAADDMVFILNTATAMGPRSSMRRSATFPEADSNYPRGFSRLSAIRRPPRLDMDSVRQAEGRGSLTSLPDLIRRATRLAASLDRGRRPASRFDMDDIPPEFQVGNTTKFANVGAQDSDEYYEDKHQSGLSDMLAAFPPPAQALNRNEVRSNSRDSVLSWPLQALDGNTAGGTPSGEPLGSNESYTRQNTPENESKDRRCCGMPFWAFVLIVLIIVILVTAAIVIPIELLVVQKNDESQPSPATADQLCRQQLVCLNGGTNIVTNGICSCICSNGFNGFNCGTPDSLGCTSTTVSGAVNLSNVTLGDAIPRLLAKASTNFAVNLSDTAILSKLNAGNLSCTSQNALVTFNGDDASNKLNLKAVVDGTSVDELQGAAVFNAAIATLTIMAGSSYTTTLTVDGPSAAPFTTVTITTTSTSAFIPETTPTIPATTPNIPATTPTKPTPTPEITAPTTLLPVTSAPTTPPTPEPTTPTFVVSDQVLDFARVSVLLILQQDSLTEATTAQSTLQSFFTKVTLDTTKAAASNVTLGNGNTIDLVNFKVDAGAGVVGSLLTTAKRDVERIAVDLWARDGGHVRDRKLAVTRYF